MHILIVAVSSAKSPSGICRHATGLAISLAGLAEVSRVTLLVGRWQEAYFKGAFGLKHAKVQIIPVQIASNAISRNVWYMDTLPSLAETLQPDIVHLSFPAPISRRRFGCPVVTTIHDAYPYDIPDNFGWHRAAINRLFLRRCVRQSNTLVCVSDFTLARIRAIFDGAVNSKVVRIYPHINVDSRCTKKPALPGLADYRFILTVAQHRRNKNLPLLISAFSALRQRDGNDDLRFLIVGATGPETPNLTRLSRQLCLENHVAFANTLREDELHWLYENCALFATFSTIEGFGHPIIEALSRGSRVLCSDIPVYREVAGSACYYINLGHRRTAATLADAMAEAMTQPASKPTTWNRFSQEEAAGRHLALYYSLICSPAKSSTHIQVLTQNESLQKGRFAN